MFYCISVIIVGLALIFSSEPYPEEWEKQDEEELLRKFEEYKKSQEN
jgi:hypothetical protein